MTANSHYITPDPESQYNGSTLAPSEKHLEEWLLKNPDVIIGDEQGYKAFQQFVLPSGITDLIFFGGSAPIILIELKKGAINSKALTQALRYMRDLRAIAKVALDIMRSPFDGEAMRCDPELSGYLIGHSLEDKNLLIAAEIANIQVMTYDYNPQTDVYEFEEHRAPHTPLDVRYNYVCGALGEAIQEGWIANVKERAALDGGPTFRDVYDGIEIFRLERDFGVVPFWRWMQDQEQEQDGTE